MKRIFLMVMVATASLTFYRCSPSTEQKVDEAGESIKKDIQKEKEDLRKDLRALRDDIDVRLDKISKELETAQSNSITQLEETKTDLKEQRAKIEKELNEIDQSADDTWEEIRFQARKTADEVKVDFQRLAARIDSVLTK